MRILLSSHAWSPLPPNVPATYAGTTFFESLLPFRDGRCCVLQIAIDVLHLSRLNVRSEILSILVASQCLLLWLKIQYFAR